MTIIDTTTATTSHDDALPQGACSMDGGPACAFDAADMAQQAQVRASFYALASIHFNRRPDEVYDDIFSDEHIAALEGFVGQEGLDAHDDIVRGCRLMLGFLQANAQATRQQMSDALGVDRTKLYRGITPTYGPAAPYESEWTDGHFNNVNEVILDVVSDYYAHGIRIADDSRDRSDYIGIELEYCRELVNQEASAWSAGRTSDALALARAQRDFLAKHLGRWSPRFIEAALGMAATDFYRGHLIMLRGLLAEEAEYLKSLPLGGSTIG